MNLVLVEVQSCMLACIRSLPGSCMPLPVYFVFWLDTSVSLSLFMPQGSCTETPSSSGWLAGRSPSTRHLPRAHAWGGLVTSRIFVIQLAERGSWWTESAKQRCRITVLCSPWCYYRPSIDQDKLPMLWNLPGPHTAGLCDREDNSLSAACPDH